MHRNFPSQTREIDGVSFRRSHHNDFRLNPDFHAPLRLVNIFTLSISSINADPLPKEGRVLYTAQTTALLKYSMEQNPTRATAGRNRRDFSNPDALLDEARGSCGGFSEGPQGNK
jgi:hypothetical protein